MQASDNVSQEVTTGRLIFRILLGVALVVVALAAIGAFFWRGSLG